MLSKKSKSNGASLAEALCFLNDTEVLWRGRRLAYFGGCDYLRFSRHRAVRAALRAGIAATTLNVAASRKTTGNHELYQRLEAALARFFQVESALLTSTGYLAGFITAQALAGEVTHALIDARAYACLHDAAAQLGAPVRSFEHRSPSSLGRRLRGLGRGARPVVLTDGLFAHDGSVAPLAEYLRLLPRPAVVVVDDAHGAGTLGATGRGTPELLGVRDPRVVQTITLSKAFGVFGGAVLGTRRLAARIIERSRAFAGSTPIPLPLANAALQSLELFRQSAGRRRRLEANARFVKQRLASAGLPSAFTPGPIVSLTPQSENEVERLRRRLLAGGIYPGFIRYPACPGGGYFRFAISSAHHRAQLEMLSAVLRTHLESDGARSAARFPPGSVRRRG